MLWAVFTLAAAALQTVRNALQRDLVAQLGLAGATHVRFLFGFPFAVVFVGLMLMLTRESVPHLTAAFWPLVAGAALAQIVATALMLAAMHSKTFVIGTAYTKIEPVLVALFGVVVFGERFSPVAWAAISVASLGVMLTSWPKTHGGWSWGALMLGLASAGFFATSALGFRAAIHSVPQGSFGVRASFVLVVALGLQAIGITIFLAILQRPLLFAVLRVWRPSLLAGFFGALASQFWFLGFALASAALVRTLALVEVLFAFGISGRLFSEKTNLMEGIGLSLILIGVAALLLSVSLP